MLPPSSWGGHVSLGDSVPPPAGAAFLVEHRYPLHFRRGPLPLAATIEVPSDGWNLWLRRETEGAFCIESAAFVDLETTGLERGTGTYAFLIGVGRFVDGFFRIRQFFMRDYNEEPAVLEAVLEELKGIRGLVTFNGLNFDWPLLQTRATLNRLALPDPMQLDLLYPARRLWRPVTGDCRLLRLEEDILGVTRHGDVPGYLIPHLYFHYLQTGDAAPLAGVLEHNRQDLLTTVALAGYLGAALSQPLQAKPLGQPLPGSDLYGIGRLFLERREWAKGVTCLEEALQRGLPDGLRRECRQHLARAYRRMGCDENARQQWHALIHDGGWSVEPYVELAKYYEHRAKNVAEARWWTLRAMDMVQRRRFFRSFGHRGKRADSIRHDPTIKELAHRLRRLDAKLSRQGSAGGDAHGDTAGGYTWIDDQVTLPLDGH